MSARKVEQETAAKHPRETSDLFGHSEAEAALLNAYRSGTHSACLADRRRAGHRQGDSGLSDGALRARQPPSARALGAARARPRRRPVRSGGAAGGGRGPWRTARAGTRPQRPRRNANRDHRRRDARDHFVLRLDCGGRGLAGLHRRHRRRAQSECGQCAAQDSGGAAAAIAVPAGKPRAVAGVADHFVPLPQIAVATARRNRRHPRRRGRHRHRGGRSGVGGGRSGRRGKRGARADAAWRRRAKTAAEDRGAAGEPASGRSA